MSKKLAWFVVVVVGIPFLLFVIRAILLVPNLGTAIAASLGITAAILLLVRAIIKLT